MRDVFSSVGAEVAGTVPYVKACALTTGYLNSRGARRLPWSLSQNLDFYYFYIPYHSLLFTLYFFWRKLWVAATASGRRPPRPAGR